MSRLYLDLGNYSLKWALDQSITEVNTITWEGGVRLEGKLDVAWSVMQQPQSVWISNVANADKKSMVVEWIKRHWGATCYDIQAEQTFDGIINEYERPQSLGSDRWAALIGARSLYPETSIVVIDAGTAITIDVLDNDNHFRGGVIMPGIRLMYHSLIGCTEKIGKRIDSHGGEYSHQILMDTQVKLFAKDTATAVHNGILLAAIGGIERTLQLIAKQIEGSVTALLTGGDAHLVLKHVCNMQHHPDLVIRGIDCIASLKVYS